MTLACRMQAHFAAMCFAPPHDSTQPDLYCSISHPQWLYVDRQRAGHSNRDAFAEACEIWRNCAPPMVVEEVLNGKLPSGKLMMPGGHGPLAGSPHPLLPPPQGFSTGLVRSTPAPMLDPSLLLPPPGSPQAVLAAQLPLGSSLAACLSLPLNVSMGAAAAAAAAAAGGPLAGLPLAPPQEAAEDGAEALMLLANKRPSTGEALQEGAGAAAAAAAGSSAAANGSAVNGMGTHGSRTSSGTEYHASGEKGTASEAMKRKASLNVDDLLCGGGSEGEEAGTASKKARTALESATSLKREGSLALPGTVAAGARQQQQQQQQQQDATSLLLQQITSLASPLLPPLLSSPLEVLQQQLQLQQILAGGVGGGGLPLATLLQLAHQPSSASLLGSNGLNAAGPGGAGGLGNLLHLGGLGGGNFNNLGASTGASAASAAASAPSASAGVGAVAGVGTSQLATAGSNATDLLLQQMLGASSPLATSGNGGNGNGLTSASSLNSTGSLLQQVLGGGAPNATSSGVLDKQQALQQVAALQQQLAAGGSSGAGQQYIIITVPGNNS